MLALVVAGWVLAEEDLRSSDPTGLSSYTSANLIPRYSAIVIGINSYRVTGEEGWDPLTTAEQDAQAVAAELESHYGFSVTRLIGSSATRQGIMGALDQLSLLTERDAVLVYYAGHGYYDKDLGEGFWIPYDAKSSIEGRPAREDWIWNSVLTRILGGSKARHVLVVADSCYGGSLFRSPPERAGKNADNTWYVRALCHPSRYLITSGDYEPVQDTGARHSVFAQLFLNFLRHHDGGIFAASEIGMALRKRVGEITGQMVRMGPLAVPTHAGGEFIFVAKNRSTADLAKALDQLLANPVPMPDDQEPAAIGSEKPDLMETAMYAALLGRRGATNSARRMIEQIGDADEGADLRDSLNAYLSPARRVSSYQQVFEIMNRLKTTLNSRTNSPPFDAAIPRPRIIALMDAPVPQGGTEAEAQGDLLSVCLLSELTQQGGVRIVEREILENVLQELEISSTGLGDPETRLQLQRLIPAGGLLYPRVLGTAGDRLASVRLVDTETAEVLWAETQTFNGRTNVLETSRHWSEALLRRLAEIRPLKAKAALKGEQLTAPLGAAHQILPSMSFWVVDEADKDLPSRELSEKNYGLARLIRPDAGGSTFSVAWKHYSPTQTYWLVECPMQNKTP